MAAYRGSLEGVLPNFNREAPMAYFSDFDCGVWFHILFILGHHYNPRQFKGRCVLFYVLLCPVAVAIVFYLVAGALVVIETFISPRRLLLEEMYNTPDPSQYFPHL
jgi:hypothetical protein